MRFKRRHAVGIGIAVMATLAATLALSLATASALPGPAMTATVPGTTVGPPITTVPVPTTTDTVPSVPGPDHKNAVSFVAVKPSNGTPVAGQTFRGLTFRLLSPPSRGTINWVECDAKIGDKRLHARQQSFFAGPHHRKTVICRWRIPADAAGKRLRLWKYEIHRHYSLFVVHARPRAVVNSGFRADTQSWNVEP